jgi:hypothetical protein
MGALFEQAAAGDDEELTTFRQDEGGEIAQP